MFQSPFTTNYNSNNLNNDNNIKTKNNILIDIDNGKIGRSYYDPYSNNNNVKLNVNYIKNKNSIKYRNGKTILMNLVDKNMKQYKKLVKLLASLLKFKKGNKMVLYSDGTNNHNIILCAEIIRLIGGKKCLSLNSLDCTITLENAKKKPLIFVCSDSKQCITVDEIMIEVHHPESYVANIVALSNIYNRNLVMITNKNLENYNKITKKNIINLRSNENINCEQVKENIDGVFSILVNSLIQKTKKNNNDNEIIYQNQIYNNLQYNIPFREENTSIDKMRFIKNNNEVINQDNYNERRYSGYRVKRRNNREQMNSQLNNDLHRKSRKNDKKSDKRRKKNNSSYLKKLKRFFPSWL